MQTWKKKFRMGSAAALLSAFGLLALTGCAREKIAEKYPNGKPKVIRNYGWIGGETKANMTRERKFYFNDNPESDAEYKDGQLDGRYADFWHNGQKKNVGRYDHGKKRGEWIAYFNQFTVSSKGGFQDDLQEGPWNQYWENGSVRAQGVFLRGKEIGTWKEWDNKGQALVENSCFESNPEGRYQTFHANKSPKEDYDCRAGVPNGAYVKKDPDGAVLERGSFDAQGKKDGLWETFNPEGKKESLRHYLQGEENDSVYAWDAKGRLRERGFFAGGSGERLTYDTLGHLIGRQRLKAGRPDGEGWAYWPSGANRSQVIYQNGVPAALKKWHANGKLMAEGQFRDGKRAGAWQDYFDNGKLAEVTHYVDGVMHGDQLFYDVTGKLTRTQRYEHGYPAEGKVPAALGGGKGNSHP